MHCVDLGERILYVLKFRCGYNTDVVSLAFLSQQFPHCCLPCPGGKPGPGRFTVVRRSQCKKEAKGAAPGRRQKASSGDKGAQKAKKARVAPKGK